MVAAKYGRPHRSVKFTRKSAQTNEPEDNLVMKRFYQISLKYFESFTIRFSKQLRCVCFIGSI